MKSGGLEKIKKLLSSGPFIRLLIKLLTLQEINNL